MGFGKGMWMDGDGEKEEGKNVFFGRHEDDMM